MTSNYFYVCVNLGCLFVPFLYSFSKHFPFYKYGYVFFLSATLVAVPFLVWDEIFTNLGVWGFDSKYLVGVFFGHLPLEEILFFYCIPFACVFSYFAIKKIFKKNLLFPFQNLFTLFFLLISLLFIVFSKGRLYPLFTGIFTFVFLLWAFYKKINLSYVYGTYFFVYPFFFISNGILTGSFLESPIVWYDDTQNFFIRIGTIPIEDSLYGFLLIAMNILCFEKIAKWFKIVF